MKKISKKLGLSRETVRVLAGADLEAALGGANASPTTTIANHSRGTNVTAPCVLHSYTGIAMCVPPTV